MKPCCARRPAPVPLAPRHRRDWRRWGRYCVCGLRWRHCPDRHAKIPVEPSTRPGERADRADPAWSAPTAVFWSGVARLLTRGQADRADRRDRR